MRWRATMYYARVLDPEVLASRKNARMHRLDGHTADWSAVDQKGWSPPGSVMSK
jgi:hypothetical protein